MSTAFIDPLTGDFPESSIPIATGNDAICQRIKTCLCLILGESCFYPDAGIDITSLIYTRPENTSLAISNYREKILSIPGVSRVIDFTSDPVGTSITYSVSLESDDGEILETNGIIDGL